MILETIDFWEKCLEAFITRNLQRKEQKSVQDEFNVVLVVSKKHSPRKPEYIKNKTNVLNNAGNIYEATEITINAFKHKMFQYY